MKNNSQTTHQEDNQAKVKDEAVILKEQLAVSIEREKRALADYQNLQRRNAQERLNLIKMANRDLCQVLLQPLEHLSLAALNLHDKGLDMVVDQFWRELSDFGLQEIEVMGKNFDVNTMEVVDKKQAGEKVVDVVRKGYTLNGEVIQHTQVILD